MTREKKMERKTNHKKLKKRKVNKDLPCSNPKQAASGKCGTNLATAATLLDPKGPRREKVPILPAHRPKKMFNPLNGRKRTAAANLPFPLRNHRVLPSCFG